MTNEPSTPSGNPSNLVVPGAYPSEYVKDVLLRGRKVTLRPIRSDDDELMLRLFDTFSRETIYHRFFTYMTVNPMKIKRFTNIDYKRHFAIVAETEWDGGLVLTGDARYNMPSDADRTAEIAIVVGDPYRSIGIGTALLDALLKVGRAEGFKLLYGLVHYDNKAAPGLVDKLQVPHRIVDTGAEWRYEMPLD